MKETQEQFVKRRLRETGRISRNECLQKYISRLGAIMNGLKNKGWKFNSSFQEQEYGSDYVYELVSEPAPVQAKLLR